jgi:RNA polymerase sigma-70 factor, ECF subfamily
MEPGSEAQLLECCRRGDAGAWDTLFDRHYAAAGRFVFQLCPDFSREDVEEICQETFLTVIRSIATFRGRSQFQTWLFRIAINKARDYREKQRAAKRGGGRVPVSLQAEDPETGLSVDLPSPAPGPDTTTLNGENLALIGHALELLGNPCREIIELRYFADLSYEEISAALELNPKTVSSRLSKCLGKLGEIARPFFSGAQTPVFPSNS